jgi:hypothetical protein
VLFAEPLAAVRAGAWSRFWFGPVSAALVLALALAFRTPAGHRLVGDWAIMRADDPLLDTLRRVPLSLFAPAHLLPFWTSMIQVCVVFGGCQVLLGWRRTLGLGLLGHVVGTLSARLWVLVGPPTGLAAHWSSFADAGPSVAAMTLGAYLLVHRRVPWLAAFLILFHVSELVTVNGLSQREHLVGVTVGAAAAGVALWRTRASTSASLPLLANSPRLWPINPPTRPGSAHHADRPTPTGATRP